MPATSKAQQKAAGAALSAKRGETKKSELRGASRQMYESMSEKQLEEFAETKRKACRTTRRAGEGEAPHHCESSGSFSAPGRRSWRTSLRRAAGRGR